MKKKIYTIIQIVLILIIAYSLYNIGSYFYGRYKAEQEFSSYRELVEKVKKEQGTDEESIPSSFMTMQRPDSYIKDKERYDKMAFLSLDRLKEINADIVSFINIDEMDIKYPVVHKDNEFYLRRNLKKEYSLPGSIFVEEKNKPDFSDMNTVVYGHNMSNAWVKTAEMFEPIMQYGNSEYVNSKDDHFIEIFTKDGVKIYRVFSAYYSDAYYDYRNLNMEEDDWIKYLDRMKSNSLVDFGLSEELKSTDKILTLSTCDNVTDDGRFAVHAVLIQE